MNEDEPRMSDALIQKIIESQTRDVFEGAPEGVRILLENTPAKDILAAKKEEDVTLPPNGKWKIRLHEYLLSLKARGGEFIDPLITEPDGNETALHYAMRVMPIVTRAEATKEP